MGRNINNLLFPGWNEEFFYCLWERGVWLKKRIVAALQLFRDSSSLCCRVNQALVNNLKGKTNSLSQHIESCCVSIALANSKAINLFYTGLPVTVSLVVTYFQGYIGDEKPHAPFWKLASFLVTQFCFLLYLDLNWFKSWPEKESEKKPQRKSRVRFQSVVPEV